MATFLTDLANSIFTPGPTPSIIIATNASFAALQVVLLALLVLTYSIHFAILSALCAGLWWAINWFVTELEATNQKEKGAGSSREMDNGRDNHGVENSETETEVTSHEGEIPDSRAQSEEFLKPDNAQGNLRKRKSLGETSSGDLSTDSDWDKVDEASDIGK